MAARNQKSIVDRSFQRFQVQINAQVRPIGVKNWAQAELVDLSKGGSCLYSSLSFFVGQLVEIQIFNSEGKETLRKAVVVWRKLKKHGINFIG